MPTRSRPSRRLHSLPAAIALLLVAGCGLLAAAAVAGACAGSANGTLAHQVAPLRENARAIESGMAAMDNAVRGAVGGSPGALAPYDGATRQVAAAEGAATVPAKRLGGGLPAALAQLVDAATAWQRGAEPLIAAARTGSGADAALNARADALFIGYRAAMSDFAAALDRREASLRSAADTARTLRTVAAFGAGFSALLAALILAGWCGRAALRRRDRATSGALPDARRLLDGLGDAVVVIDPQSLRVRGANAAMERLSGQSRAELLGTPSPDPAAADRERGIAGAVLAANAAGRSARSYRYTWVQPGGARVPLEGVNGVIDAGGAELLVAVLRDLRGRLESERELGDSRDQLEAIIQGVADGILMQDAAGIVTYANETAARILGYDAATALIGKSIDRPASRFEVLDERGEPLSPEQLPVRRVLAGEPEVEALLRYRSRVAGERWVVFRSSSVRGDGGQARFVLSVLHDLTPLMRAQEELRRSRDQLNAILQGVADGIT
ncbi:MAG TPA: PAS domain S-box protein, partial [Dehalococcoidia bacterium]|nr:PAS domain S-box protein [Dehalococcoidia bacterium]